MPSFCRMSPWGRISADRIPTDSVLADGGHPAKPKVGADPLVQRAGHDLRQHLLFARRERRVSPLQHLQVFFLAQRVAGSVRWHGRSSAGQHIDDAAEFILHTGPLSAVAVLAKRAGWQACIAGLPGIVAMKHMSR